MNLTLCMNRFLHFIGEQSTLERSTRSSKKSVIPKNIQPITKTVQVNENVDGSAQSKRCNGTPVKKKVFDW